MPTDTVPAARGSRRRTVGWSVAALYGATVAMGSMTGLFFAWDVSVMPGLGRLDAPTFLAVLAVLIVAIENPVFYAALTGAFVLTAAAALGHRAAGLRRAAGWIAAALALYVVAFAVTGIVHVPLNTALLEAASAGTDPAAARAAFEQPWRTANVVRTVVCGLALLCLARALTLGGVRTAHRPEPGSPRRPR